MTRPAHHPLREFLDDWLPEMDFGVMSHGFTEYVRDYFLEIELAEAARRPGRYVIWFTHVTELTYETRVGGEVWSDSWDDVFIDYEAWTKAGEPDGRVWGTNWSLAYPGLSLIEVSPTADKWKQKIGKHFFEITLETDTFFLSLIFHGGLGRAAGARRRHPCHRGPRPRWSRP
jgi:hypothetical protein